MLNIKYKGINNMRQPKTICNICGKEFKNGNSLRAHKSVHSKKEFICKFCGEIIIGASSYKRHLGNHALMNKNEKEYICEICNQKFDSLMALNGHKAVHKIRTKKQCIHCNENFNNKNEFYSHIESFINDDDNFSFHIKNELKYENIYYVKCKICGINKIDLTNHIINHHNITLENYIKNYDNKIKSSKQLNNKMLIHLFKWNEYIEPLKNLNLLLARGIMNHKEKIINDITPNNVLFADTKFYISKNINGKRVIKNPDFIVIKKDKLEEIEDEIKKNSSIQNKKLRKNVIGIIEHFGEYWHGPKFTGKSKEENEKEIIEFYKLASNLKCLVIWENDVINNLEQVKININIFLNSL